VENRVKLYGPACTGGLYLGVELHACILTATQHTSFSSCFRVFPLYKGVVKGGREGGGGEGEVEERE